MSATKIGQQTRILSRLTADDFIGRQVEIDEIRRLAREEKTGRGLLISSAPAVGASELLRQAYDHLFTERGEVIPFYFAFNKSDGTNEKAARRFLHSFLLQVVAFRRSNPKLLDAAPELNEIAELAAPSDGYWIDRLIAACENENNASDERAFVRQILSAPLRAAAHGATVLVMIDDFEQAERLQGAISLVHEIKQIYARSTIPFIISGRRRHLLSATQSGETRLDNTSVLTLAPLSISDAGALAEKLARKYEVSLNEQTRDLIVQQLECNPTFISDLILAARDRRIALDSFNRCQQIYTQELLGGRIGRYFTSLFDEAISNPETQRGILSLLRDALLSARSSKSSIEFWQKRVSVNSTEFYRIMRELHWHEIVRLSASVVEMSESSQVALDYIRARHRLEIEAVPRALVIADTLAETLKRAPKLMARYYRRSAALGLREILGVFNLQSVPQVLFDYSRFKRFYNGVETANVGQNLAKENDKIILPQIVYAASCEEFYPPIQKIADTERTAVALGFESGSYADETQIVWIAAEIESKLEATAEMTEFWLDRLEAAAVFCNFKRAQFWLVSPEGFSSEALELLAERGAFSSSRAQIELLAETLHAENILDRKPQQNPNEYQFVMPMGDDTELIATQAVEEIARKFDFKPTAINQIKTALVEACINASEHSSSTDRKIYQKFAFENDQLVITVSNRGLQMSENIRNNGTKTAEDDLSGRHGWGLRLIQGLMDEVKFIQTDDGTSIRMSKRLS